MLCFELFECRQINANTAGKWAQHLRIRRWQELTEKHFPFSGASRQHGGDHFPESTEEEHRGEKLRQGLVHDSTDILFPAYFLFLLTLAKLKLSFLAEQVFSKVLANVVSNWDTFVYVRTQQIQKVADLKLT